MIVQRFLVNRSVDLPPTFFNLLGISRIFLFPEVKSNFK